MSKYINIIILLLLIVGTHLSFAQEHRHSIKLYFRQGDTKVDAFYKTNADEIRKLDSLISVTKSDSILAIEKFMFRSGVSPEGNQQINHRIAIGRLEAVIQMIKKKILLPDSVIEVQSNYTDWSLLRDLVDKSTMQYRTDVLHIIDNVPEQIYDNQGNWVDGRRKRLMDLKGGKLYTYLFENFFPMMRYAESTLTLYFREPTLGEKQQMEVIEEPVKEKPVIEFPKDPIAVEQVSVQEVKKRNPFYLALATNMLYDAALVPNIGIEFYLGKQWSLQGDWHYAWWWSDRAHNYWRVYGGGLELRKWFGGKAKEKPLQGHHFGVYGLIATYDFELGGRGYLGDKWSWSAGIGYGYSLPITKRINFDLGLNIGYLSGEYKEYLPVDDHYVWQLTKNRHYFGVTKAYISFVWLLGHGNYNERRR